MRSTTAMARHVRRLWTPPRSLIHCRAMRHTIIGIAAIILTAGPTQQSAVEYGRPDGHPLLLDLHAPAGSGPFPAAILVHGGGFDSGSRMTNMAPLLEPLDSAGSRGSASTIGWPPSSASRRRVRTSTPRSDGSRPTRRRITWTRTRSSRRGICRRLPGELRRDAPDSRDERRGRRRHLPARRTTRRLRASARPIRIAST